MKKAIFFLVFTFLISNYGIAQVIAYPSLNNSRVFGAACVDLHYVNPIVIGHQLNVSVTYYETIADAQNMTNVLNRLYIPLSNPQTIYARVDHDTDSSFAIAECSLIYEAPSGPPPGISPCYFEVCDSDSNGSELINLNNIRCKYEGYGFPNANFCSSLDSEIQTTYYLSESDAINETNPVNPEYTITGTVTFYRKIKNVTSNESLIDDLLNFELVSCSTDSDNDGIPDLVEDPNRNLLQDDDDTDLDGLKNYLDADDDGDGILTINEDYNNNGDPTDDDTNSNGIADYLESNVTLSIVNSELHTIKIYPNPVTDILTIKSKTPIKNMTVYNNLGQMVLFEIKNNKIDVSKQQSGLFYIKIEDIYGSVEFIKILKE